MPTSNAPTLAVLPWLAALAGTFAVHLGMPWGVPPEQPRCVSAELSVDPTPRVIEHVIDRADFDRLRADARQSATPTRAGLRLRGIRPGSLFAELGFESGDLVVDIDGGDATRFHVLRGRARRPIVIVLRIA
jgi:hypothetical protein